MTRSMWTRYRKWERKQEREHKVWSFVGQYGFILFAIYVVSEFVLVPIFS